MRIYYERFDDAALLFSTINTILLTLDKGLQNNSTMYTKGTTLKGSTPSTSLTLSSIYDHIRLKI